MYVCVCVCVCVCVHVSHVKEVFLCVSSGGAPTLATHQCSLCANFHTYTKCEVETQWGMGMGHLWMKLLMAGADLNGVVAHMGGAK